MGILKLNVFDKVVLFIAVFIAIGLALGFMAGNYDPRQHIMMAFFGLAYPFFLGAILILLAYWLIRTKWVLVLATLVLIGLGWRALFATYGFLGTKGGNSKSSELYLRMMTYNVHQFKAFGSKNDVSTKNQIIEVVKAQNPDVVCFQEFYSRYKGEYDIKDSIKKVLNMPYFYFEPSVKNSYEAYGLAIFSKYPIKNKGSILFGEARGNESIFADIQFGKNIFRVYNVHFQSISFQNEDYQYLEKVTKQMNTEIKSSRRIASMLKYAFQKRAQQVDIMLKNLNACSIPYIIAGDFNDTPASYTVTQITKSLNNAFVKEGSGLGKTYNGKFPNFQIDYIASTKQIEVLNYQITPAKLSDHYPVRSDLRLNYSSAGERE